MSLDPVVSIVIPERLDRSAALSLRDEIEQNSEKNIALDGSQNAVVSGPGLQVIHLAKNHWEASGWGFEIVQPSEKLSEALKWLGHEQDLDFGEI